MKTTKSMGVSFTQTATQRALVSIFSLIFAFSAAPAGAASYVQNATGTKLATAGSPTVVTATLSSGATTGNMLIAVVGTNGNVAITGPAGWNTAVNQSGNASQGIFYKTAVGGETVVSASVASNPGSAGIHVYEYSGASTLMTSGSSNGNTNAPVSGSVTTTAANELVFAAFFAHKDTSVTNASWNDASEGFTERNDFMTSGSGSAPDANYSAGDNLANAAGAKSVTVSIGSVSQWRGQIVRFQLDTTAPAAVSNLALSGATVNSINLAWTAPGDDGSSGTANSYDIRYSTSPISNDSAFNSATQVTGEPAPLVAGSSQSMTVSGLSSSTLYYFAMKTSDEVPNVSALSNVPSLSTSVPPDTTAPAAVTTLALSGATVNSINLAWTAPGDDGSSGTAASYDIRYSTAPIATDSDFNAATQVTGEPAPLVAGSAQSMTVSGLSSGTLFYFAMKSSDEVPNISALSNSPGLATLSPPDTTAPAAITTLALSGATTSAITLTWTAPGDDGNSGTASLYDIHYSTSPILTSGDWMAATDVTPAPPVPAIAGTVQSMTVTGLTSSTLYYFAIKTYDEVPNISALSNSPGLTTLTPADTTAPAAVSNLALSGATTSSITLTWTAPGDDGATGTAASYDIRYSTSSINGNFGSAIEVIGEPAPAVAGTVQSMTVSGLSANTVYYFALKTYDEAPNLSLISNVPSLSTLAAPDVTAPATVSDLATSGATTSSITLTWTAPGDDGASGTASSYDIRYSDEYPITSEGAWSSATSVTGEPAPAAAGTVQSMTITGLTPNRNYRFAIKTSDEVPNVSGLSNSPNLSTLPLPDTTAPAAISNLALSGATSAAITLTWTAPGDDGASGTASYYDIHYSTSALNGTNFESGTHVTGEPVPAVAGTVQSMTVSGLNASTTYYFAMKTADEVPNISSISNVPSLATLPSPDTTAPAAITTLALSGATTSAITLTWTAPGDDGASGTAASYDIRYSTSSINGNFGSTTQVIGEPVPGVAGTVQSMTVSGLSSGTTYYFAMKTSDEVPNVSALSNVPSLSTLIPPDVTAPSAVTTLTVTGTTDDSVTLSWTAPGDDGAVGTAAAYDMRYSTSSITNNAEFSAANVAVGEPAPAAAGTIQSMTVSGLTAGNTYFFAIKTSDEVPNISGLSNTASALIGFVGGGSGSTGGSSTDLVLSMSVNPVSLPAGGGKVTFTYTLVNKGRGHVTDVSVRDDLGMEGCAPVSLVSGDVDIDGLLDNESRETWTYTCVMDIKTSASHTAAAHGFWNFGYGTSNPASAMVLVGPTIESVNAHFHVRPFPAVLHPGGGVSTMEYHVGNLGETPITDVHFSGDFCKLAGPVAGDANNDGLLDKGEHWQYTCTGTFSQSTVLFVVFTGKVGNVMVSDTAQVPIDVGTAEPHAGIHLHVLASPASLPVGGGTTFLTYYVSNDGNVPLSDIDLSSGSSSCSSPTYEGGDSNSNGLLEAGERWVYTCIEKLTKTEADAPSVHGHAGDRTVTDNALFVVPVATLAPPLTDPTIEGVYDAAVSIAATPDIDTNQNFPVLAGFSDCIPGVNYKLPSDKNPDTEADTTVYYCGRDGKFHAFPNRKTYLSWYSNFDGVRYMDKAFLATIPRGQNVIYRPGARLIKTQADNRTYVVARGGLLRWVRDESGASTLYGPSWRSIVDDLPQEFFGAYSIGKEVASD